MDTIIARSDVEAFSHIPDLFKSDAAANTLDYIFNYLGHKSLLIVKENGRIFQIKLRPSRLGAHYVDYLPSNLKHKENIRILGCIAKEFDESKPDDDMVTLNIFQKYGTDVDDGIYFVSPTDSLILRKDLTDPWIHVVRSRTLPITTKSHAFLPILAMSSHRDYRDVPIVDYDDYLFIEDAQRGTPEFTDADVNLAWETKRSLAVFRGSSTGCGWTAATNTRLAAVKLSKTAPTLLDAQLTKITAMEKFHIDAGPGFVSRSDFKTGTPIDFVRFSDYKYILHIDGNVAAYRLAKTMLLGSVILLVESGSTLWFQHHMKPGVHYIPIKEDLSNLLAAIKWCQANDVLCKQIAQQGRALAKWVLTPETVRRELAIATRLAKFEAIWGT